MRSVLFIYILFLKTKSENDDRRIFLGLKFDFGILGERGLENYGKHFLG